MLLQVKWFSSVPSGGVIAPTEKRTHFSILNSHPSIQLNLAVSFNTSQFEFLEILYMQSDFIYKEDSFNFSFPIWMSSGY